MMGKTDGFKAENLIKQVIERYGKQCCVACSFGKDSLIVLHMVLKYNPNIKVVFHNTGVEFPETIEFKKRLKKEWNLNLYETDPYKGMTFFKCADKYGLPGLRGSGNKARTPRCCWYLKEKPAMDFYKKHNIVACLTGLTMHESRNRLMLTYSMNKSKKSKDDTQFCGQRYYSTKWNVWKVHPIIYWTEEDVWDYIKENNLPANPVYAKWKGVHKRVGCMVCTGYIGWKKVMAQSHPKLYKHLQEKYLGQMLLDTSIPPQPKGRGILEVAL